MIPSYPQPDCCPNCGRTEFIQAQHNGYLRNVCQWCRWSDGMIQGRFGFQCENSTQVVPYAHRPDKCQGQSVPCPLHRRSDHHMRVWVQVWLEKMMWRQCPHGLLHPDPDHPFEAPAHPCDKCCAPPNG